MRILLVAWLLLVPSMAAADVTVCLQPLGKHDKKLLAPIARGIEHLYGFEVQTLKPRPMPEAAWYAPRKRYRAAKILDQLDADRAEACTVVIGVTKHDISDTKGDVEDWGIFGLGEIAGVSAVVSSYRLGKARKKLIRRIVKVTNHELGHVLGLEHTDGALDPSCAMNDAGGTIKTVDAERGTLCTAERDFIEARHGVTLPTRESLDWSWIANGK